MATGYDKLIVEFETKMGKPIKDIDELIKRVEKLGHLSAKKMLPQDVVNKNIKNLKSQFRGLEKQIDQTFSSGEKKAAMFDMRMLSLLFGGMALKRAFGGMLRSIVNTYVEAEDHTSGLSHATTRLSASWKFLQFSIMDALNADWFIAVIDQLINMINWVSQLNSGWKIGGLSMIAIIAAIGTAMMVIGQIGLGWHSIFGVGGFLNHSGTIIGTKGDAAGKGATGLKGIHSLLNLLAIAGLIYFSFNFASDAINATNFWAMFEKAWKAAALAGVALIIGGAGIGFAALASIAVLGVIAFVWQWETGGWKSDFKMWWAKNMGEIGLKLPVSAEERAQYHTKRFEEGAFMKGAWEPGVERYDSTFEPNQLSNKWVNAWGSVETGIGNLTQKYDSELLPKTSLVVKTFNENLTPSINGTEIAIDNITNEAIPNQVSAIDNQMIPADDRMIESTDKKTAALGRYFAALQRLASESDIDGLTNVAAPTGESE